MKRRHNFDPSSHLLSTSGMNSSRSLFSVSKPALQILRPHDFTSAVADLSGSSPRDIPAVTDEVVAFIPSTQAPDPSIQDVLAHNAKQIKRYDEFMNMKMKSRFETFVVKIKGEQRQWNTSSELMVGGGSEADQALRLLKVVKKKDQDQFNSRDDHSASGKRKFLRTKSIQPNITNKVLTLSMIPERKEDYQELLASKQEYPLTSRLPTETAQHDTEGDSSDGDNDNQGLQSHNDTLMELALRSPIHQEIDNTIKIADTAELSSVPRKSVGFGNHARLLEANARTIVESQFSVRNKTDPYSSYLPCTRENHLMVLAKQGNLPPQIVLIGGVGSDMVTTVDHYTPARFGQEHSQPRKMWEFKQPCLENYPGAAVFKIHGHRGDLFEGTIYFFGGYVSLGRSSVKFLSNDIYSYKLSNNEIIKEHLSEDERRPRPRIGHSAAVLMNIFVVVGGRNEKYDYRNDVWMLTLRPRANYQNERFGWSKLEVLGPQGAKDTEFADVCGHTLTAVPKSPLFPKVGNTVGSITDSAAVFWRSQFERNGIQQSGRDQGQPK